MPSVFFIRRQPKPPHPTPSEVEKGEPMETELALVTPAPGLPRRGWTNLRGEVVGEFKRFNAKVWHRDDDIAGVERGRRLSP